MTNQMIIYKESQRLAEEGVIKYTGRQVKLQMDDGKEIIYNETEEIHTYQMWKELGYQVQKGQKAVAQFTIWKHTAKVNEETGEQENAHMFMKKSSFFSRSQVQEIA